MRHHPHAGPRGPRSTVRPRTAARRGAVLTALAAAVLAPTLSATGAPAATTAVGASALPSSTSTAAAAAVAPKPRWRELRRLVVSDGPVAHIRGNKDLVTGATGTVVSSPGWTKMPDGTSARVFDGTNDEIVFPSRPAYSVATTGQLTVEYWIRPDVLQFRDMEGSGYVHLLGKGRSGANEWFARMYSLRNSENRPNRLSAYVFNPAGGLGSGSYVQDKVYTGRWIQLAFTVDVRPVPGYPMGRIRLYQNGVLRDTDSLADYGIRPVAGSAPLRIGTGTGASYFQGAIGDVIVYGKALTTTQIKAHRDAVPLGY